MAKRRPAIVLPEPHNVLNRIQRGLAGYISYLATCEMNAVFTEYMLYEPILRILTTRGYAVKPERKCPNIDQPRLGDKRKLDFVVEGHSHIFAIEVKWTDTRTVDVEEDLLKLIAYKNAAAGNRSFLCVFGTYSMLHDLRFRKLHDASLASLKREEFGKPVFADLTKTRYGCRVFEIL
jgi:hypothetical protein